MPDAETDITMSSSTPRVRTTDGGAAGPLRAAPPVGAVELGSLRRLQPISPVFGYDRGLCIDRFYIERFLERNAADIHGHVLEVADNDYTQRFGGDRVSRSDVLHVTKGNGRATIVGDLTRPSGLPRDAFDCVILTQTLQHIYDVRAAVATVRSMLKGDGVVLATVPGISQISRYDMERWGDYWRFTTASARRLFEEVFSAEGVAVEAFGNVLTATAFLHGMAADELSATELNHRDADYELLVTVRAQNRSKATKR